MVGEVVSCNKTGAIKKNFFFNVSFEFLVVN